MALIEPGILSPCADYPGFMEFFVHPDDADVLVREGMMLDGRASTVTVVDEWPFGKQIRVSKPDPAWRWPRC